MQASRHGPNPNIKTGPNLGGQVSRPSFCFRQERVEDVFDVVLRHRITGNSITRRPLLFGKKKSAKQQVEDGQMNGEILIDGFGFYPMVPVVEARRHQNPLQPAKPKIHVCMDEDGVERNKN